MKVAFDEHVPLAIVRAFESFANEHKIRKLTGGLTVQKAKDYAPNPGDDDYLKGNDVPWIRRFSRTGGKVIISGDTDMMAEPHERLALLEEKMIVIFFQAKWSSWKFNKKCALIMYWWPKIVDTIRNADQGTFWRVPSSFSDSVEIEQVSTEDQKLIKIARQRAAQPEIAARRRAARDANQLAKQSDFGFPQQEPSHGEEP